MSRDGRWRAAAVPEGGRWRSADDGHREAPSSQPQDPGAGKADRSHAPAREAGASEGEGEGAGVGAGADAGTTATEGADAGNGLALERKAPAHGDGARSRGSPGEAQRGDPASEARTSRALLGEAEDRTGMATGGGYLREAAARSSW
jgi:hypothetical protein